MPDIKDIIEVYKCKIKGSQFYFARTRERLYSIAAYQYQELKAMLK